MLSGKTAVDDGASRGIGRAIAEKLAAEGALLSSITMVQKRRPKPCLRESARQEETAA